ncbi:MAG: twin-arginine translocase subunit TatC [Planctomycetota bacterium]|jgi:sec-independent protein translocase protein TatC|nr:twin-arginine translocase subunit TatC [Planctomycetota bacterium]
MGDEEAPPLEHIASAPFDPDGADDTVDIVDSAIMDFDAREAYLTECAGADAPDSVDAASRTVPGLAGSAACASLPADKPAAPEEEDDGGRVITDTVRNIGPHLDELRRRLVFSVLAFIPAFAVGLWLYQTLWDALLLPLRDASPHLMRFQALTPSDGLLLMMRIAFAFALFVSMPIWISQAWAFVSPGLSAGERRWLYLACGAGGVLFFMGVLVAYFGGIPLALGYLLPLNQTLAGWENSFTGGGYVDFIVTCCFGFGAAFELPLVMLVLGWAGLITPEGVRAWWRYVVLFVFVLSAVMTPPDPFSQLMLALPMLGLFFIGYFLVKWTGARKRTESE